MSKCVVEGRRTARIVVVTGGGGLRRRSRVCVLRRSMMLERRFRGGREVEETAIFLINISDSSSRKES